MFIRVLGAGTRRQEPRERAEEACSGYAYCSHPNNTDVPADALFCFARPPLCATILSDWSKFLVFSVDSTICSAE